MVRPALPEPAVEDRRRAAAAALYMSITTTEDAQEQPAAAGEDDYYGDLYDEDAYYDEVDMPQSARTPYQQTSAGRSATHTFEPCLGQVVYGYDEANPYNDAEVPRNPKMHQAPIAPRTNAPMHHAPMRQCTNAPMHQCTNAPMHQCRPLR